MAQHLHARQSLGQERCPESGFPRTPAKLDSTIVKVHPDGTGALKNGVQAIGKSRGGWTTKIHLVAADARTTVVFSLSPGQAGDAPEGRKLLKNLENKGFSDTHVIMDKAIRRG